MDGSRPTSERGIGSADRFDPPIAPAERRQAARAGRLVLCCDGPAADGGGGELPLPIVVEGWAFSRHGVERVYVRVDELSLEAATGISRPDVAKALLEPHAQRSGFRLALDARTCPPGRHCVSIVAVDRGGQTAAVTIDLVAGRPTGLDNGGERYVPEVHSGRTIAAQHEARYLWAGPLAAGRDVLDAACGVGWGTLRLLESSARSAVGIDLDAASLESGRERCRGRPAEFIEADVLSLPFADASFDLVVSFETIEHVDDPLAALDELRRVLRPDGLLVVSTPNRGVYPGGNPFHRRELTAGELSGALAERFRNVELYRQQDYTGSLLSDGATAAISTVTESLAVEARKLHGEAAGDELFTIAIAGSVALPKMAGVCVLGQAELARAAIEHTAALEQRAGEAELKLATVTARAAELERTAEDSRSALADTEQRLAEAAAGRERAEHRLEQQASSLSWRLTAPLRTVKRLVLRSRAT
jgi:SAM-dependent methyltransferase